jgi:hypothetical protein
MNQAINKCETIFCKNCGQIVVREVEAGTQDQMDAMGKGLNCTDCEPYVRLIKGHEDQVTQTERRIKDSKAKLASIKVKANLRMAALAQCN